MSVETQDGAAREPEVAGCPACGGPLRPWRTVPTTEPGIGPASFTLARCGACGTAVTLGPPVPEAHSTGAYGGGRPRGSGLAAPLLARFDRARLELVGTAVPAPARLIDAGAGRGRFVTAAAAAGYDAIGVEPVLRAVPDGVRPRLIEASIQDAPVTVGSAEVVTLWHVLEHVPDPGALVDRLAGWLTPGGVLLVGVPNLDSWQARWSGGRWYHLDLPRHRTHFTARGVSVLLRRHGFEVVRVEHRLLEHNPFGMWQSLVSLGTRRPSYLYHLLKRNAPWRSRDLPVTVAALVLVPVALALEWLAARFGRGGTVAVVARRRA